MPQPHAGVPRIAVGLLLVAAAGARALGEPPLAAPPTWKEVRPVFERACTHCHGGDRPVAGLSLDTHALALKGSGSGAVLVPGKPDESRLVKHLRGTLEPRMPYDGDALPEHEIALVEAWLLNGAKDDPPPEPPAPAPAPAPGAPAPPTPPAPALPPGPATFDDVSLLLRRNCVRCHQERGLRGPAPEGLRLSDLESVLRGGDRVAVIPGKPEASPLVRVLRGQAEKRMPLDGPPWLAEGDIARIERWIRDGARDAAGSAAPVPVGRPVRLVGTWSAADRVDDVNLVRGGRSRIDDDVRVGARVEVRARVRADGGLEIDRVRAR